MIIKNIQEMNDYVLLNRGCFGVNCSTCFYKNICDENNIKRYVKFIYEYVVEKEKLKRLKEILQ